MGTNFKSYYNLGFTKEDINKLFLEKGFVNIVKHNFEYYRLVLQTYLEKNIWHKNKMPI